MHIPRFSGHLKDSGFLKNLPAEQTQGFQQFVAQLPDYMTIEVGESGEGKTREFSGHVKVQPDIYEACKNLRNVAQSRGQTIIWHKPSVFKRFPGKTQRQWASIRQEILESVSQAALETKRFVTEAQAELAKFKF